MLNAFTKPRKLDPEFRAALNKTVNAAANGRKSAAKLPVPGLYAAPVTLKKERDGDRQRDSGIEAAGFAHGLPEQCAVNNNLQDAEGNQ